MTAWPEPVTSGLRYSLTSAALALVTLAACAAPTPSAPQSGRAASTTAERPSRTKSVVFGVTSINPMAMTTVSSSIGGWASAIEFHTNGLITSDLTTRKPIGRLAERAPNIEDGSLSVLPDGRMRVVYNLRKDVTWQDGVPFNAQDL